MIEKFSSGKIYKKVDKIAQDTFIRCFLAEYYVYSCFSIEKEYTFARKYLWIPLNIFFDDYYGWIDDDLLECRLSSVFGIYACLPLVYGQEIRLL
ncbi:hypothetical protein AGMMS5026_01270 [Endomicrobiia bacterium]|nr:hypothetical protein AGMMS49523_06340 [Endomicrobiia bacterium]GHT11801.1 hypothetical protein AGMMS49571_02720 [Endomicrobiia bacterium]GHT19768.1 hypothetical protein AGMMS49929_04300 [Endomicrobiia bacterium]GHT26630.1 hypothetical protein AGMMS49995_03700 [Endomicrobiia bacterium]GHT29601.1 hypothetical protein AGMMS5026_01270 [Endomicrobiia bacterium]